jgi:protein ImuB
MAIQSHQEWYACLYIPDFHLHSILRIHPEYKSKAIAILEGQPAAEYVISINHHAAAKGLHCGLSRVEADLFDNIIFKRRSADAEEAARSELLHLAYNVTPRIEDRSQPNDFTLILDVTKSIGLFKNLETIAASILDSVSRINMMACVVISSNIYTAECIARYQNNFPNSVIVPQGKERRMLGILPIEYLPLTDEHQVTLRAWGINSFHELASLSTKELITCFGQHGKKLSDISRGVQQHLLSPLDFTPAIKQKTDYDDPISSIDSLLFSLSSMLSSIMKQVADQYAAVTAMDITCRLQNGHEYALTIKPSIPSTDKRLLLKLLHLNLVEHPPQSGVLWSQLIAHKGQSNKLQQGLFSPQTPDIQNLDMLMARIHSIVGKDNAGSPFITDSHAPDSCVLTSFCIKENLRDPNPAESTITALRRTRPELSISMVISDSRPHHFSIYHRNHRILSALGPWTNSGGWFDSDFWNIETWDISAQTYRDDTVAYYCLSHNMLRNEWQLDGIYD